MALDELEPVDVAFYLALAPGELESCFDRIPVSGQVASWKWFGEDMPAGSLENAKAFEGLKQDRDREAFPRQI